MQYRVPQELSTWWQWASHVGRNLDTKATATTTTTDRQKIDPEMDDFINAEHRPCNCRRAVTSSTFGNVGLSMFIPYLSRIMPHLPSISLSDRLILLQTLQGSYS